MFCENLQFNLSLYLDDCLTTEERALLNEHLSRCPLCRQKLAEYQNLRQSLRVLPRPEISNQILNSIRKSIAVEVYSAQSRPKSLYRDNFREWLQMRVMPYTVGTVASLFLTFFLLTSLLTPINSLGNADLARVNLPSKPTILLTNSNGRPVITSSGEDGLPPAQLMISDASPSINPTGALVALTRSFARGEIEDEEVVVVADVFGNGLARITEVVEPKHDRHAIYQLEKALQTNPEFAPFVPAKADHRAETVRVVFKIQKVDVITKK